MENSPEQFIKPESLNNLFQPAQIPESAAQALGGIGLGDVESTALPANVQIKPTDPVNTLSSPNPELQETAERIRGQFVTSLRAYDQFTGAGDLFTEESVVTIEQKLEEAIQEWTNNGDLEYIRQQQEADPDLTFDLVINNGETLDRQTLYLIADAFAKGQDGWNEAYIRKDFLEQYTDEELSGPSKTGLSFILIPNKYTIQPAGAEQQVQQFEQLKQETSANLIIPSMKDAVALWYVKRQQQREASKNPSKQLDTSNFNDTFIRHINLTPKGFGSVSALPESCVGGGGRPDLYDAGVEDAYGVRVAVG